MIKAKIKNIWKDPVVSAIIAAIILPIVYTFWSQIKSFPYSYFLFKSISFTILELTVGLTTIILLACIFIKVKTRKKVVAKKEPTPTIEEKYDIEYQTFKKDKTFKHFDDFAKAANSRLHFDQFDRNVVDYYLAKGILFDSRPGHGYYILTQKGTHFFNKRAIEKVNGEKKPRK